MGDTKYRRYKVVFPDKERGEEKVNGKKQFRDGMSNNWTQIYVRASVLHLDVV